MNKTFGEKTEYLFGDDAWSGISFVTMSAVCEILVGTLDDLGPEGLLSAAELMREEEFFVPETLYKSVMEYLYNEVKPKIEEEVSTRRDLRGG